MIASRLGTFSLSGSAMKVPVHRGYWAACGCGWEGEAGPKDESPGLASRLFPQVRPTSYLRS
jgi:hypothetical protein